MLMLVQPSTVMAPFADGPVTVLGPLDRFDEGELELEEPELDDELDDDPVAELPAAVMTADASAGEMVAVVVEVTALFPLERASWPSI